MTTSNSGVGLCDVEGTVRTTGQNIDPSVFGDEVDRAAFQSIELHIDSRLVCHEDHWRMEAALKQQMPGVNAGSSGQRPVEQRELHPRFAAKLLEKRVSVGKGGNNKAARRKAVDENTSKANITVGNSDEW